VTSGEGCSVHRLVADVCLMAEGHVLLVRYRDVSKYDGERGWFLPDDFLETQEHPHRAARRILEDQLGIQDVRPALGFIESFGNSVWHLIFHHRLELSARPRTVGSAALASAEWFSLDALPPAADVAHGGWALEIIHRHRSGEVSDQP